MWYMPCDRSPIDCNRRNDDYGSFLCLVTLSMALKLSDVYVAQAIWCQYLEDSRPRHNSAISRCRVTSTSGNRIC